MKRNDACNIPSPRELESWFLFSPTGDDDDDARPRGAGDPSDRVQPSMAGGALRLVSAALALGLIAVFGVLAVGAAAALAVNVWIYLKVSEDDAQ